VIFSPGARRAGGDGAAELTLAGRYQLEEPLGPGGMGEVADATKITTTGSWAGTPLYMTPEQIRDGQADQRTDLYAFGCVLYRLSGTGHPCHVGKRLRPGRMVVAISPR
jgi:hypothetical protein